MIPILDLTRQYKNLKAEFDKAVISVMESGAFILGPEVKTFEVEVAKHLGCNHAIGVASGTDALYVALRALEIGPGDEVLTTAFSYIATSEAIVRTGATPVFVEINPETYNIDVSKIEARITSRTKAILPVHLYGQPVEMAPLMEIAKKHNLYVVEDCAQSFGTEWEGKKIGTIGTIGCYSFFPTKNLGCFGDGGLMVTNDSKLDEKIRMLRAHGSATKYDHVLPGGVNSRLDEMQAAILRVKMPHIDNWNARRREIAQKYSDTFSTLSGVKPPKVVPGGVHVFHQYTLRIEGGEAVRNQLQEVLKEKGVMAMIYYPIPLHLQGAHKNLGYQAGDLPITEKAAKEVLSLPIFPELSEDEINQVIEGVRQALGQLAQPV